MFFSATTESTRLVDRYEAIVNTIDDGLYQLDAAGRFVAVNDRIVELLGIGRDELIGEHVSVVLDDETIDRFTDAIRRSVETDDSVVVIEAEMSTVAGEFVPFEFRISPLREDGDFVGTVGVARDISQRYAYERRLEREKAAIESELEAIFDRISDGVFALDEQFRFTHVNERAASLFESDALLGKVIWDTIPGKETLDGFRTALDTAIDSQSVVTQEVHYPPIDSWLEMQIYPSETGVSIYFHDITERVQRDQEIELYETTVETIWDGVATLDPDDNIVMVNNALCEMTGFERDALVGEPVTKIHDKTVNEAAKQQTQEVYDGEREFGQLEFGLHTADGDVIPVEGRFGPYEYGEGEIGKTGVMRDVSERRAIERERERRTKHQEVIAKLGQSALTTHAGDLDELFHEATTLVADTLDTHYCKVLDLDEEREELLLREGVGWRDGIVGEATVAANENSQAGYTLLSESAVLVTDLHNEHRFSGPELLTSHEVTSGISTIIGSIDNPWGILGTHDTERRSFTDEDVQFVQSVANILAETIERIAREVELQRYETTVETVWDGVTTLDADERFVMVNRAFCEMTGYDRDEVLGEHVSLIIDEATHEQAGELHEGVESGEIDVAVLEYDLKTADGGTIPVEARFGPTEFEDGTSGGTGVIRDMTEHKARERALREYETIVETINDGVYVLDDKYRFVLVNDAYVEMTGRSREELIGAHCSVVVGDEISDQAAEESLDLAKVEGEFATIEAEIIRPDGTRLPGESRFTPLLDNDGVYRGTVGVVRDLTERRKRERALEESERRYRTLAENFPGGVVALFDEECRYLTAGGELLNQLGIDSDEVVGESIYERYPPELVERIEPHFETVFEGEHVAFEETYYERDLYAQAVPVRNGDDEIFAGMLMVQDITERKEHERELAALNRLNESIRSISHAAAEATSREMIEQRACETVLVPEPYSCAWFHPVDRGGLASASVVSGDDGGLFQAIQRDDDVLPDPIETAYETGSTTIVDDVREYPPWDSIRAAVDKCDVRAVAAIPVVHEEIPYGVLTICADTPSAFTDHDTDMLTQLGEIVGHAINAIERRKALVGDSVTQLELQLEIDDEPLAKLTEDGGKIVFDRTVPSSDDAVIHFVTVTGIDDDVFLETAESIELIEHVRQLASDEETSVYEVTSSGSRLVETLTRYSGQLQTLTIEDGHDYLLVDFPTNIDIRSLLASLEDLVDGVDLRAQRTRPRDETTLQSYRSVLADALTDRQRVALETAYFAGYFDWPRSSTGEDVAEILDLSSATFTQHLRIAERKIFDAMFAEAPG